MDEAQVGAIIALDHEAHFGGLFLVRAEFEPIWLPPCARSGRSESQSLGTTTLAVRRKFRDRYTEKRVVSYQEGIFAGRLHDKHPRN